MQSSVLRTMTQVDHPFSIEDGEIARKGNSRCRSKVGICGTQLYQGHVPVDQYAATTVKTLLNKLVGGREMLQQVFIFYIVDLDNHVLERAEELPIERRSNH